MDGAAFTQNGFDLKLFLVGFNQKLENKDFTIPEPRIKEIGEKHKEYCEENEIDFVKNIMLIYDIHNFKYSYILQ